MVQEWSNSQKMANKSQKWSKHCPRTADNGKIRAGGPLESLSCFRQFSEAPPKKSSVSVQKATKTKKKREREREREKNRPSAYRRPRKQKCPSTFRMPPEDTWRTPGAGGPLESLSDTERGPIDCTEMGLRWVSVSGEGARAGRPGAERAGCDPDRAGDSPRPPTPS